jgi:hypothetical protein
MRDDRLYLRAGETDWILVLDNEPSRAHQKTAKIQIWHLYSEKRNKS